MKINKLLAVSAMTALVNASAQATLIGDWTFEGSGTPTDVTGHFTSFSLIGNASVFNGALTTTGSGTSSTGYGRAYGYTGSTITSKTMVVWFKLNDFNASAGGPMTVDRIGSDQFDSIDFGEFSSNTWANGSSGGSRTNRSALTYTEATAGQLIEMAYTYQDLGNGSVTITGYRNGTNIGSYTIRNATSWSAADTEILFGPRATIGGGVYGGLDATIYEAQLYDTALTSAQVNGLRMSGSVPEPGTLILAGLAAGLGFIRRRPQALVSLS